MGKQVSRHQLLRRRAVATAPEPRRQSDTDRPAERGRPSLNPAPGNTADAIGTAQHDQRPAVLTEQSGLGPLPPLPLRIAPAVPLMRAGSGRTISQAGQPRQIIFAHRPEGHLTIHGSEPTTDSNGDSNGNYTGERERPVTAHDARTIRANLRYVRPGKRTVVRRR